MRVLDGAAGVTFVTFWLQDFAALGVLCNKFPPAVYLLSERVVNVALGCRSGALGIVDGGVNRPVPRVELGLL